jgi:hypothetical protein
MDNLQFNGSAFTTAAIVSGIGYCIYAFTSTSTSTNANTNANNNTLFDKAKTYFSDNNKYSNRYSNNRTGKGFFDSLNPFSSNKYNNYDYDNNNYNNYNKYNYGRSYGGKKQTKKNRK